MFDLYGCMSDKYFHAMKEPGVTAIEHLRMQDHDHRQFSISELLSKGSIYELYPSQQHKILPGDRSVVNFFLNLTPISVAGKKYSQKHFAVRLPFRVLYTLR